MEKLKIGFECTECKNKPTCPPTIKSRTKEISEAIRKRYLPIPFLEGILPKNVYIEKECSLKQKMHNEPHSRLPKTEWFTCDNCFSRPNCKFKQNTKKFINEKQHIVNGNINSPLITAPWVDSNIYCEDYQPEM